MRAARFDPPDEQDQGAVSSDALLRIRARQRDQEPLPDSPRRYGSNAPYPHGIYGLHGKHLARRQQGCVVFALSRLNEAGIQELRTPYHEEWTKAYRQLKNELRVWNALGRLPEDALFAEVERLANELGNDKEDELFSELPEPLDAPIQPVEPPPALAIQPQVQEPSRPIQHPVDPPPSRVIQPVKSLLVWPARAIQAARPALPTSPPVPARPTTPPAPARPIQPAIPSPDPPRIIPSPDPPSPEAETQVVDLPCRTSLPPEPQTQRMSVSPNAEVRLSLNEMRLRAAELMEKRRLENERE